jgi:hypothetical protein
MLDSASRRLGKALKTAETGLAAEGAQAVERAKAAVDSLTKRLADHRNVHHC